MRTLELLAGGYPALLVLVAAIDAALGWPLADALEHPHP